MMSLLLGFSFSTIIATAAYTRRNLTESGALAAIFIGSTVYFTLGWFGYLYLIMFFVSATLIGHLDKAHPPSQRTASQVFANGLLATVFATVHALTGQEVYRFLFFLSVAASASDTWASEVGRLSKRLPRNLLTWRVMQTGLSGGVTVLGFVASIIASGLFALMAWIVLTDVSLMLYIWLFATLASVIDSALGIIQVKYMREGVITEERTDDATRHSGLTWLNNNLVNILSNALAVGLFVVTVSANVF